MTKTSSRWWLRHDREHTTIAASPRSIYDLVADLPRMGEWSPECQKVLWTDDAVGPAVGARFIGHNRAGPRGLFRWSRRGRVLVAEPGREFAFVTEEGGKESTIWRYRLEPSEGGARVTESYQVKSIPAWDRIFDVPTAAEAPPPPAGEG
jgi:Polyketide cyclase / dehydrase and lipid transport